MTHIVPAPRPYTEEKLDGAFAKLARKPWVPGPLKGLFERARAACKERRS